MATSGFKLDTSNRDEVVAFWHAVYQASEGYDERVGWTGTFPSNPGTTSAAFVGDVQRRINYFRAMTGLPTNARVNSGSLVQIDAGDTFKPAVATTKSAACQSAALMIAASYNYLNGTVSGMSHNPAPAVPSWTTAAWNAAAKGNLAFGTYGPGSIDEYAVEELLANTATSQWNSLVGHRRWLLVSTSTNFATGDYPGESAFRPPSNVLYIAQRSEEVAALTAPPFVCYPPKGYFPASLNSRFWSVSRKGADFSAATVQVVNAVGVKVPISSVQRDNSFGEPALIWQVSGPAAERSATLDRRYRVTVQGIQGVGVPKSLVYDVTLINPNLIRRVPAISGPNKAAPGKKVKFKINSLSGAKKSRLMYYHRAGRDWLEGGETAKPDVIDMTSPIYPLLAASAGAKGMGAIVGKKSFNLTFPEKYDLIARGVPEQIMELGPWIHTQTGSKLEFLYRRGLMSDSVSLVVEISNDRGVSWQKLGQPIKGYADARPDVDSSRAVFKLPKSKYPQRVRFRYFYAVPGGPLTTYLDMPGFPTGIFLDEITLEKCEFLDLEKTQEIKGTSFVFQVPKNTKSGDRWTFGLQSEFGGGWLRTGPHKELRIQK